MIWPISGASSNSHPVAALEQPHHNPACSGRGLRRRDPSVVRPCMPCCTSVRPLDPPELIRFRGRSEAKSSLGLGVAHDSALHDHPSGCVLLQGNQQLAGRRHDHRLPEAPAAAPDALLEPQAQGRSALMAQPQPGELDHGGAQARIAGFRHALLTIHRSALPGRRSQALILLG
jgi:hypothetical protein